MLNFFFNFTISKICGLINLHKHKKIYTLGINLSVSFSWFSLIDSFSITFDSGPFSLFLVFVKLLKIGLSKSS
jgi:hypothetical protein